MIRRIVTALFLLVLVGGASWYLYSATAQEKEPPPPDYEIFTVGKGDIAATVSATGAITPIDEVNLSFRGVGVVREILVAVGQAVAQGQVLARLDSEELLLARRQAAVGLQLAQARLDQAARSPAEADVAASAAAVEAARAGLASAQAAYEGLLRGPTAAQRRAAEANLERARVLRDSAQSAYDQVAHLPNVGLLPQSLQLQQATIDYEVAKANVDNTLAPATAAQKAAALAQIAQAESAVAQAGAALARLTQGLASEDRAILEAQVEQAQIAVDQAALAFKNAELVAPVSGIIGAINIRANEPYSPGLAAMVLAGSNRFRVELNVDEIDIGRLRVGQAAEVTVDALDNAKLAGVVSEIAPLARSGATGLSTSVVTYRVRVDIADSDRPLKSGMSATVAITTDEARDVVVLPNRVMRLDRQTGQTYVERIEDGIPRRVDLQIGLRNDQFSEVRGGVAVGDQLAVRRVDTGEVIRQQFFGG